MVGFGGLCRILAMLPMPHAQTKYENCGCKVGLPQAFGWRKAESIVVPRLPGALQGIVSEISPKHADPYQLLK